MINLILSLIYLMLPAYIANMMPVFVKKINFLNTPVDFNKKYKGKPVLGSHKTWRGLFFGVLGAVIIAYIQFLLQKYPAFSNISLLDYSDWFAVGFLLGFGALSGDIIKSFFKRRVNIKPGKPWIPWDQLDYAVGAMLFIYPVYPLPFMQMIIILSISFFGHILFNHLGYYLKIRKQKW
jgi:CDP-2,3-bis-(O-geranylgeranyl)-sn-glycerol synthase